MNYRQRYPGVGGSIEQLFPLRSWCAVLSFGLDPVWVLRRRTGGVQAALSALSNEQWIAPYIGGSPDISASAPWMIMLPVWRSQLFINALVSEHRRATSGYQREQRRLTADPRWGRQPVVE